MIDLKQAKIIFCTDKIPTVNGIWRKSKAGFTYKTKEGKDFCLRLHMAYENSGNINFLDDLVTMKIVLYFKDNRRRDLDNHLKGILDSLNGAAYNDDSQIQELTVSKFVDRDNPRLDIEITKMEERQWE